MTVMSGEDGSVTQQSLGSRITDDKIRLCRRLPQTSAQSQKPLTLTRARRMFSRGGQIHRRSEDFIWGALFSLKSWRPFCIF